MHRPAGWRAWAGAGVTLLALSVAACGTPRYAESPAADPVPEQAETLPSIVETPAREVVLPEGERLAAASPADVALPASALPGPERLAGLTAPDVSALLGSPGFVRRDPPAEVWQYRTETCVLDLFLYADGAGQPQKVSHFEFRGRTVAGVAAGECYRELLAVRPRSPAG